MITIPKIYLKGIQLDLTNVYIVPNRTMMEHLTRQNGNFGGPRNAGDDIFKPSISINVNYSVYSSKAAYESNAAALYTGDVNFVTEGTAIPKDYVDQLTSAIQDANKK